MIIRVEPSGGIWSVSTEHCHLGRGLTRREAIREARRIRPEIMDHLPIQPDEIPGELREIAKRMRAVSEPLIYFGGFGVRGDLGRSMEAQAPILAAWADLIEVYRKGEKCA